MVQAETFGQQLFLTLLETFTGTGIIHAGYLHIYILNID